MATSIPNCYYLVLALIFIFTFDLLIDSIFLYLKSTSNIENFILD